MKRVLAVFLLTALTFLCGCQKPPAADTAGAESLALSNEDIASAFTEIWEADYQKLLKSNAMMLGEGKAFLTDLTGEGLPELFFLYDNYKNSGVAVYDISGTEIKALGSFAASSFYNAGELVFELYGGGDGNILYTKAVQYGGVADGRNWVTEVFVGLSDGKLHTDTLSSVVYTDGTATEYQNSAEDGTPISEEEYNKRRNEILGDSTLRDTIVLQKDGEVCEFTDGGALREYILALLGAYFEAAA